MKDIIDIVQNTFPDKRVVIVGDMVADQFLNGSIARVSREAPVFILRHEETATLAGGAANAAVNVASLGGKPVLIGVTGTDENGGLLLNALDTAGVDCAFVVRSDKFRTTTKVRVLAGQQYAPRQQVIRIDYENPSALDDEIKAALRENLSAACASADAIIISDYNYGVANTEMVDLARKIATEKGIPLLIDSRFRLREFAGATSATPNQEEVEQILGKNFTVEGCDALREDLRYEALLVTCGNKGMILAEKGREPVFMEAIGSKEPVDVTGAGDTVIAVYALCLASEMSFAEAAEVANHAGGVVVMKKGTAFVNPGELFNSINSARRFQATGQR
jgi:D-glycero-beta-D-manno-heptose-7-phosphate kinase